VHIPDATKNRHTFCDIGGRVIEAPVRSIRRAEEYGTGFPSVVANGNHIIEVLPVKFLDGLGAMPGNIDACLSHRGNGFRSDRAGSRAHALHVEPLPASCCCHGARQLPQRVF
jgi:hypothetical protein